MRLFLLLFSVISVVCAAGAIAQTIQHNGYEYQQQAVPDWVLPIASAVHAPATSAEQAGVNYLIVDEQLSLQHGQYLAYSHIALQANSRQGLNQASEFSMQFAPDYQQLVLHYIHLTRDGAVRDVTKEADIRLVQREDETAQGIYNGLVTAMVLLSDIQVGDRIDYAYSVNGTNPIYKGKRSAYFRLNWGVAVNYARVRLLTDKTTELFQKSNLPDFLFEKQQTDTALTYQWQQHDIAAVQDEGEYPAWFSPYAFLEVSEFQDWQDVVRWAEPLYKFNEPLVPELQKLADSWRKEASTPQEYAALVVRYVQNQIRYFGIEIGLNSHQPYAPNLVFERKYGDCKDKTTLMLTLLQYGGIEAYPALVSSRSHRGITERLPNPGVFDHVITYMKLGEQEYWIDGTRSQQYGPLAQKGEQYFQQALLVKPDTAGLTAVTSPDSKQNLFRTEEHFVLGAVGAAVKLDLVFKLQGESAESFRRMLDRKGLKEYSIELEQVYRKQYPGADILQLPNVTDNKEHNQLLVNAQFTIDEFWDENSEQQKLMLYGDSLDGYVRLPEVTRRQMPIAIEPGVYIEHLIHFQLAEPIDWDLDELALSFENSGMRYQREIKPESMQISVLHQYQSINDVIPVERTGHYIQQLRKIRDALYYSVVIDNDKSEPQPEQRLRQRFRELLNRTE